MELRVASRIASMRTSTFFGQVLDRQCNCLVLVPMPVRPDLVAESTSGVNWGSVVLPAWLLCQLEDPVSSGLVVVLSRRAPLKYDTRRFVL